jgi:hypothetical protein
MLGMKLLHLGIIRGYDDWSYDASCTLTSPPVWDLENVKCFIFVAPSAPVSPVNALHEGL